jgi:aconitate hydratase
MTGQVLIVLPENISTGSMAPDGAIVMADRSNRATIAEYTFMKEDPQGFARIHRRNLIAQGLVPLNIDADAHDRLELGDRLAIRGLRDAVTNGVGEVEVQVESKEPFRARLDLSPRERQIVVAGGVLNHLAT